MSKAFIKDNSPKEVPIVRRELVPESENYLTLQGFNHLTAEVVKLQKEKLEATKENSPTAEVARSEIDHRLELLAMSLVSAIVIDPSRQMNDKVVFGATVTVADNKNQTRTYYIVGVDETDASSGKVSYISPIGKALLQKEVGDSILLKTPQGAQEELEIQKIEFKPIPF